MAVDGSLFASSSSRSQSKNLVEFKAGKMNIKGKMVHPDKRKGMVYIYQSDDSLMHFCWKDRQTGTVEDDLIIFPDDCEYKHVVQCTTGRVYILKFKSSSRKCFFWMQEPKTDKDEEYLKKVNEYLNNPPARSSGTTPGSGSGIPSELSSLGDGDLQNLLNNMSQQQLMQLFGGVGGMGGLTSLLNSTSRPSSGQSSRSLSTATTTTATVTTASETTTSTVTASSSSTTTTTSVTTSASSATPAVTTSTPAVTTAASSTTTTPSSSSTPILLSDLQSILSGIAIPPGAEGESSQQRSVDLSSAFSAEFMQPVLSDPAFIEQLQGFLPQIGEKGTLPSAEQLRGTIQSPQFQQALSMFSAALQSGQLGPLIAQFGLGEDAVAAATQGDMEAFVRAMQKQDKDKKEKSKSSDKKDKDDDEMALD